MSNFIADFSDVFNVEDIEWAIVKKWSSYNVA